MKKNNEEITYCLHCENQIPFCYVTNISEKDKAYFCMNCGFSSNTMMVPESQYLAEAVASMPQLYVDALYKDETGKYWFPTTVNLPEQGMVFLQGTCLEDAQWVGIKATEVLEEEKEKFKIKGTNNYHKYKMDQTTLKKFGKHGFMEALAYVDLLPAPEVEG